MGEFSKNVGDHGENIVTDFLKLVGWSNLQGNIQIESVYPVKHKKGTHGIDRFFHYNNPMIAKTVNSVLVSSKYSSNKYSSLSSTFKSHYYDLAFAIESYKRSALREQTLEQYTQVQQFFDKGLLFWINNDSEDNENLYHRLSTVILNEHVNHDGIFLVDNCQLEFLSLAVKEYCRSQLQTVPEFIYHQTGLNSDDDNYRTGKVLPVEMMTTSILPMKSINAAGEIVLSIFVKDNFDANTVQKVIGLAKNLSNNLCNKTIISFPDFNRLQHESIANNVMQGLNDSSFTNTLTITNYKSQIRG